MTAQELIRSEIRRKKITPFRAGKLAGLDQGVSWRFFNQDQKRPQLDTVLKYMRALKIDMQRLNEIETTKGDK
jgi:hypothetical protein